ncbi:Protein-disulfide isomerase [Pseudosulfitobacter pseudonitzschiae]|uniref:DsbA family protein n=1 Tax=Pseudosulfitobacter pseudonitzschiae TaxID=1402135 RepID=UPI0009182923|nr:DsbA family protein [Pseudosulfitobacter pseudonitzschiae]SHG12228.1 Protein-disulfide isomerase [Pseudosulfitobacter pseudonitzschiae]
MLLARRGLSKIVLATVLAAFPVTTVAAQELNEADIKRLALEAILEKPEILIEALSILQERENVALAEAQTDALSELRDDFEQNAPIFGNLDGSVTLVEFFDYNCGYCRRAAPEVKAVLEASKDVRIIYREFPILGPGSEVAARASLASRNQGKYQQFHEAMMALNAQAVEASVMKIAGDVGLDLEILKTDMQSDLVSDHIAASLRFAEALGITGTPTFVLGEEIIPGVIERGTLLEKIAELVPE